MSGQGFYLFGTDEDRVARLLGSGVRIEGECWLRKDFETERAALNYAHELVEEYRRQGREEFVVVAQHPTEGKWFAAPVIPFDDDSGVRFVPRDVVDEAARRAYGRH